MGTLFVVATPIGNLQDITLRAIETLRRVDMIACEDTRHTLQLLNHFEIKKRLLSIRGENERNASAGLCALLKEGKDIAYVSDAGTPAVSDPGALLVQAARAEGFDVVPVPGPSALSTLISVAGFPLKSITFEGFLSPKAGKRRARLRELLDRGEPFTLYESPYRIIKLLDDIADLSPERKLVVGREMTKLHEEFLAGAAIELRRELETRTKVVGEFAVLVSGTKMT